MALSFRFFGKDEWLAFSRNQKRETRNRFYMPIAHLTLEIRIEHAQSLKDKRQVIRSVKDEWVIDEFLVIADCPVCPHCGENLSQSPVSDGISVSVMEFLDGLAG